MPGYSLEGICSDVSLIDVVSLLHDTTATGTLDVVVEVPYTLKFLKGNVIEGSIIDWVGLEAAYTAPILSDQGWFGYRRGEVGDPGVPPAPFLQFIADWARMYDEWERVMSIIVSPSISFFGDLEHFDEEYGRTPRMVSRLTNRPLFEVCAELAEAVAKGQVLSLDTSAWYDLRLQHSGDVRNGSLLDMVLDGQTSYTSLIAAGWSVDTLRDDLIARLRAGLRFPGSGWVMRDTVWEERILRTRALGGPALTREERPKNTLDISGLDAFWVTPS